MSSSPAVSLISWSCACSQMYSPAEIDATCNRCQQPFVRADEERPPFAIAGPLPEEPSTPPRPPRRTEQHGNPAAPGRELLYRRGIKGNAVTVGLALYDCTAPGSWWANISQDELAARLHLSKNTVRTAIEKLKEAKIIMAENERPRKAGGIFKTYLMAPYWNGVPKAVQNSTQKPPARPRATPSEPPVPREQTDEPTVPEVCECGGTPRWIPVIGTDGAHLGVRHCTCWEAKIQAAQKRKCTQPGIKN